MLILNSDALLAIRFNNWLIRFTSYLDLFVDYGQMIFSSHSVESFMVG